MLWSAQEARKILSATSAASAAVLGSLRLPTDVGSRVRPWRSGYPEGLAYHYTGGGSWLNSLRWFVDPRMKNRVSSASVLILDVVPKEIEAVWSQQEAASFWPVPVLILAPLSGSSWCTNWVNDRCLGVENRNSGWKKLDGGTLAYSQGRYWEQYTRAQIIANILLGQLIAVWSPRFDSQWVVGHSQIWATKSDPGPLFPLHTIRQAIEGQTPISDLSWLTGFPAKRALAADTGDALANDYRGDTSGSPCWNIEADSKCGGVDYWVVEVLRRLGWNVDKIGDSWVLRQFVGYYQRSTYAFKDSNPSEVLVVDGLVGPKTITSFKKRLAQAGYY